MQTTRGKSLYVRLNVVWLLAVFAAGLLLGLAVMGWQNGLSGDRVNCWQCGKVFNPNDGQVLHIHRGCLPKALHADGAIKSKSIGKLAIPGTDAQ